MKYFHPKKYWRITKEKLSRFFWFYLLPDSWEISYRFKRYVGYKPNLTTPQTFNEKIQWLKLNDRRDLYPNLIDKCKVKPIVSQLIGNEYIIPTIYGPYDSPTAIPWDELPDKFVIKCNHDASSVIVCKDKMKFDIEKSILRLNRCLEINYYHEEGKQWGYKNIKPQVFVEKYMEDGLHEDLVDYKFMFFNGECKCIFTCLERRSKTGLKLNFYTPQWELLPFTRRYPNTKAEPKPKNLDKMLEIAEKLAKYVDNPFVRIDLYDIDNHIYFGEFTFYPGGGFEEFRPKEWDYIMGSWVKLPIDK